jgi:hypothetical protein
MSFPAINGAAIIAHKPKETSSDQITFPYRAMARANCVYTQVFHTGALAQSFSTAATDTWRAKNRRFPQSYRERKKMRLRAQRSVFLTGWFILVQIRAIEDLLRRAGPRQ